MLIFIMCASRARDLPRSIPHTFSSFFRISTAQPANVVSWRIATRCLVGGQRQHVLVRYIPHVGDTGKNKFATLIRNESNVESLFTAFHVTYQLSTLGLCLTNTRRNKRMLYECILHPPNKSGWLYSERQ